ncbi:hypothetical protein PFLUV_G00139810 [Perca fluviatilis]|uniref:RING-type domain-containing protein n=1 Tax=Perca fluviatilis TaxID=8168 RepID=A0A6A5F1P2_PERFL|nr:hypothetical protein PFLUV_G00139810 [Perca fluviatilis]
MPSSIYLISETGVVRLPSSTGYIGEIEISGRYEVCGEEGPTTPVPLPTHPHPAQRSLFRFGTRPVASAVRSGPVPAPATRSFSRSISIGRVEGGVLRVDGGTLYVTFMEREANVSTIAEKMKHDLGSEEEIVLCDGQGNRLIEGIGTTGMSFWKQNARKIVALCDSAYQELMRKKRRRTSGIDGQTVGWVEELVLAAVELPAIPKALRDLGQYARANRVSTVALTGDQVATVRSTFQCLICRDVMENPVVAPCCRSLVGCRVCVEQWTTNSLHCPKCRDDSFQEKKF